MAHRLLNVFWNQDFECEEKDEGCQGSVKLLSATQAADTIQGIARWRLLDELARRTVADTEAALEWLVAQGFLVEVSPSPSPPIYRFNETTIDQAKKFAESG